MAVSGRALGYALFWIGAHPGWSLAACVATFMLNSTTYVVSRPEPRGPPETLQEMKQPAVTRAD